MLTWIASAPRVFFVSCVPEPVTTCMVPLEDNASVQLQPREGIIISTKPFEHGSGQLPLAPTKPQSTMVTWRGLVVPHSLFYWYARASFVVPGSKTLFEPSAASVHGGSHTSTCFNNRIEYFGLCI